MTRFANNITLVGTLMLTVTMLAVAGSSGTVHAAPMLNATENLALNKPTKASSVGVADGETANAVDGTTTTN